MSKVTGPVVAVILAIISASLAAIWAPGDWLEGTYRLRISNPVKGHDVGQFTLQQPFDPDGKIEFNWRNYRLELLPDTKYNEDGIWRFFIKLPSSIQPQDFNDLREWKLSIKPPNLPEQPIPIKVRSLDKLVAERRPAKGMGFAFAMLALLICLWMSEALPLFASALCLPVAMVFAGFSPTYALAPFADPLIYLFLGSFLLARGLQTTGWDKRFAHIVVARTSHSAKLLFASFLTLAACLSMWMSNTASAAVLLPIVLASTETLNSKPFQKMLILGVAYASTIGGVATLIGTPGNAITARFLSSYSNDPISFAGWFAFAFPFVLLFLPIMGVYLWCSMQVKVSESSLNALKDQLESQGGSGHPLTLKQWAMLLVFMGAIITWLSSSWHGIPSSIVALLAGLATIVIGAFKSDDLGKISWEALIVFGGGLALGNLLSDTGASDWIASEIGSLANFPPWLMIFIIAALSLLLTAVASNTASAAILVPVLLPLAPYLGLEPLFLGLIVAIATSIDFAMVIGTPPTMLAYATGKLRVTEIFHRGFILNILGLFLLVFVMRFFWQWVVN